jgi:hypothetical protein
MRRMSSWSVAGQGFATMGRTVLRLWRRFFPGDRARGAAAPSWRGETLIAAGR